MQRPSPFATDVALLLYGRPDEFGHSTGACARDWHMDAVRSEPFWMLVRNRVEVYESCTRVAADAGTERGIDGACPAIGRGNVHRDEDDERGSGQGAHGERRWSVAFRAKRQHSKRLG